MGMVPTLRCHVYDSQILLMHKKQQRSTRVDRVVVVVVISHIKRIGYQPEKLLYTMANPARDLLNREKRTKKKSGRTPPHTHTHTHTHTQCSFGEKYIKDHATHLQALCKSRSVSRPYRDSFGSSTRSKDVGSRNVTLPCAITRFPVSLLLSSPGDV